MVNEQYFSILQDRQKQIALMFILIFFVLMFMVSPVLSFFSLIVFFSLIRIDERFIRFLFAMLALISGTAIYASRFVHPVELGGDDFSNQYYPLFKSLSSGDSIFSSKFGGGIEFGLAAIYKIIGFFNPTATYWQLFFIVSFLCIFLYYLWFERFIVPQLSGRDITLCLASMLLFFGFFITTQLIRQALSSVFVLYSLSYLAEGDRKKAYMCCIIGFVFHVTALPFVFLFYQLMYGKNKTKIFIVGCFIFFGILFSVFLGVMSSGAVSSIIASKFLYYNQNTDSGISSAYYWKILLILCIVYFFFSKRSNEHDIYKSLLYYGTIIYICLINIPFASDRTLMILVIFYLGIVVYNAFYKVKNIYVLIVIALSIYRVITLGPYYDTNCYDSALCLWSSYPWYGSLL